MEVKAQLKYLRQSPRKVRLVADTVRGKSISEATAKLRFASKTAASPLQKLLASAVANAQHNFKLDKGNLFIKSIRVDQGSVLKRYRPRAFGRAAPIRKKTSHITIILTDHI